MPPPDLQDTLVALTRTLDALRLPSNSLEHETAAHGQPLRQTGYAIDASAVGSYVAADVDDSGCATPSAESSIGSFRDEPRASASSYAAVPNDPLDAKRSSRFYLVDDHIRFMACARPTRIPSSTTDRAF
jgi:hypothetical protein